MLYQEYGVVITLGERRGNTREILVEVSGLLEKALNYEEFTGAVAPGDKVLLNTTASRLRLGTGGYHFVMHVLGYPGTRKGNELGHIMKLRYTPLQFACLAVEEPDSPYHQVMLQAENLQELPVVCGSLHSILPAVSGAVKGITEKRARIVYVMTDGAALPIELSKTVFQLRRNKLIDGTVTVGHAFGGDLEAVNLYSGLLAARHVLKADVIIVAMGPGIVGTGTKYGSTGIELGEIVNAVSVLGGRSIVVPRIHSDDHRRRHWGVSHHTLTAMGEIALRPGIIALPNLGPQYKEMIYRQFKEAGIIGKHAIVTADGTPYLDKLGEMGIVLNTMGRGLEKERVYFQTAAAAGVIAGSCYQTPDK